MGKEIERKFLVKDSVEYRSHSNSYLFIQGYLNLDPERTVRIRISEKKGYITVKGKNEGATRLEYEYEIPLKDAEELLYNLCEKPIIEKHRYKYEYMGLLWEIDEFHGENEGLIIAEIELKSENQEFQLPDWIGDEITIDYRYSNSNLIKNPFKSW